MITELSQLDFYKRYTYRNYLFWQLTERVELIRGYIHRMADAPTSAHQKISNRITGPLFNFSENHPCEMHYAPFDVRFYELTDPTRAITNVVEPDICVISDPEKIDMRGSLGAPDLIVEILAPSTCEKDLTDKYDLIQ